MVSCGCTDTTTPSEKQKSFLVGNNNTISAAMTSPPMDDNDDGFGFSFGVNDDDKVRDFVVPELEGVGKVKIVSVGYATTAKKVISRVSRRIFGTNLSKP
jgi:hypothetical protein